MLYAYAITWRGEPPPVAALHGAALRAVGDEPAAIVSDHGQLPLRAEPEDLWPHEAGLEGAMGRRAVLPMRAGPAFADERELLDSLRGRAGEFRRALERV